ncbi:hypothetical protein IIA28_01395 [candidate division KSB1 bacterium]|nr:hypothetical protein [candidate division KSB1 bacterium]
MFRRFLFLLTLLAIFSKSSYGQVLGWQSYTSVGTIADIAIGAGSVWGGSNGGGLLQFDLTTEMISKLTNTDGLSSNDIVAVEIDKRGMVWIAFFDGLLNRYSPDTQEFEIIDDYQNQSISDIVAFGDSLYIGLDIGVSLYTIDRREVKETYVNLGLSSGGNIEKIGANSVTINALDIWVSTDKGIARSSLDLPNLQAPSSWTQFTTSQGLPSNRINELVVLDGTPYTATISGVARLIDGQWLNAGLTGTNVLAIAVVNSNQFFPENSVVSITRDGVFWLNPSDDQWRQLGPIYRDVTAFDTDSDGNIWIGRRDLGLARYNGSDGWQLETVNGPASNDFSSLALDSRGRLWCASQISGVHMLNENGVWTNFSKESGLKKNDHRVVMVDSQDRAWAGSWGGGITIFEVSETDTSLTKIDASLEILAGISIDPTFVLVTDMTQDEFGNIWIVNREAANGQVLPVRSPQGEFFYFLSTVEEIGTRFVEVLEIDRINRIWIGTEDRGIKVIDYMGTLSNKTDDRFDQGLDNTEGLLSNKITALAEDKDGIMWIGTEEGLNFWQGQVGRRTGLINSFVNTIGIDGINNKWIGTANGITVLNNDGRTQTDYTTGNSPLVSNNIQSFAFNEETGEVWIGTTNGLSRFQTPFTAPKENLNQLTGFPNPFILDGFDDGFTITNLAANTSVNIYSISGIKVKTFNNVQGKGQIVWDGKDDDSNFVASGIYVYLAFTNNDISATGKVAVVRR